jgi:predicted GIY-YIG superfamily endonuclease
MLQFVYAEVDPRTDIPFYVGITNNLNQRHTEHFKRNEHIKQMYSETLKSYMKILEIVYDKKEAHKQERYWIQTYLEQGIQLTNIRLTGPMPLSYPEPVQLSERCLTYNQIYTL